MAGPPKVEKQIAGLWVITIVISISTTTSNKCLWICGKYKNTFYFQQLAY